MRNEFTEKDLPFYIIRPLERACTDFRKYIKNGHNINDSVKFAFQDNPVSNSFPEGRNFLSDYLESLKEYAAKYEKHVLRDSSFLEGLIQSLPEKWENKRPFTLPDTTKSLNLATSKDYFGLTQIEYYAR